MKKRNISLIIIIILAIASGLFAEDVKYAPFWELKTDNTTIYMLGSIHVADESFYPLPKYITEAFDESSTLYVEADPSSAAKMQSTMTKMMLLKNGKTLDNIVPSDTWKKLKDKFNPFIVQKLVNFKPWAAAIQLSNVEYLNAGLSPEHGIDAYFIAEAREKKKKVSELESFIYQLQIFDNLSLDLQLSFLKEVAEPGENIGDQLKKIADSWKNGDMTELENELLKERNNKAYSELYKVLLDKRNVEMADKIVKMTNEGGVHFVVVGAAHYIGDNGIIKTLEKKNFKIKSYLRKNSK